MGGWRGSVRGGVGWGRVRVRVCRVGRNGVGWGRVG